jgi:prephenate dehydrogenase
VATVAIAGVGLIGGSLGFALKKHSLASRVLGVSSPGTIAKALRLGAIDEAVTLDQAAARADVIVLAQPISGILRALATLKTSAFVTDVGSTKAAIVAAGAALPDFLGGHPMAGKESRGVEQADPDLFRGRPWVLTPTDSSLSPAGTAWLSIVERLGARALLLSPAEHDRLVAMSSHLPQLLSTALAASLDGTEAWRTAGPGLQDMTRLALSSYDIWQDILTTNGGEIRSALDRAMRVLEALRAQLGEDAAGETFTQAQRFAGRLRG